MTQDEKDTLTGKIIREYKNCRKEHALWDEKCSRIATALNLLSQEFQTGGLDKVTVTDEGIVLKYEDYGVVQDFTFEQESLCNALIARRKTKAQMERLKRTLKELEIDKLVEP